MIGSLVMFIVEIADFSFLDITAMDCLRLSAIYGVSFFCFKILSLMNRSLVPAPRYVHYLDFAWQVAYYFCR